MLGFVGHGLFDVNVPGGIFAAPPPVAIAKGIMHADRGAGVLLCVSNHSGDVLNAEMALEMRVSDDVDCRVVILGDDVSSSDDPADRRGGPGLFFAWKIIARRPKRATTLKTVPGSPRRRFRRTGSLSATIRGTVNPTTGQETTKVPDGQILVGTGVHGDGTGTLLDWCTARELAGAMVEPLVSAISLGDGDRVLTMVNDAGKR